MGFLDYPGLQRFKAKLDALFATKIDASQKGVANGVAGLDSSGKVPSSQLPSYVDDVIEVATYNDLPLTGETGKIYVTTDTGNTYRWSGSSYVQIGITDAFDGATATTAGAKGLVPAPAAGKQDSYLKGDGTWTVPTRVMTGASASAAGQSGYVPAPSAGNQLKFLRADGSWEMPAGAKMIVADLDAIVNASGAYNHTTTVTGVTGDMKPVMLEGSDLSIFKGAVTITTSTNAVNVTCSNVSGSSTVKVSLMLYGDAAAGSSAVTSAEFDILATRIENTKTPFTGATSSAAGTIGMVPAPSAGDEDKVLKADGTWGTAGLDPSDIANNVTTTTAGKVLDARQGKVLNDKLIPFSGATAQAAGSAGFVPAPATTDKKKFLCGDGTWADAEGGKLVVFDLDTVTNSGGSYTHTTTLANVTHDMKAVLIETDDPTVFGASVHVSTADGSITLSCDEVNGTAEVTVSCMFVANADPLTSSEFDVLSNRIGSLSTLTTTDKSSVVGAINELNASIIPESHNASELTFAQCSLERGRFVIIGKLVLFDIRINKTGTWCQIYGLPLIDETACSYGNSEVFVRNGVNLASGYGNVPYSYYNGNDGSCNISISSAQHSATGVKYLHGWYVKA